MKQLTFSFPTQEQPAVQTRTPSEKPPLGDLKGNQKVKWVLTTEESAFFVEMSSKPLHEVMKGGKS